METDIYQVLTSPKLFLHLLNEKGGSLETWFVWLTILKICEGLPLETEKELELYQTLTGNTSPYKPYRKERIFLCCGRRGGKSKFVSLLAGAIALLSIGGAVQSKLSAGESGVIGICSPTKKQSGIIADYLKGIFSSNDFLLSLVKDQKFSQEGFELINNIKVSVLSGSWRSIRGFSMIAAIVDEIAYFLPDDQGSCLSDGAAHFSSGTKFSFFRWKINLLKQPAFS